MLNLTAIQAASLYLALNLVLLFILGWRTAKARQKTGISLGHDNNEQMLRAMRIHANFAEYAPLPLLGLFALGNMGAPVWLIHVFGGIFTAARYGHGLGFTAPEGKRPAGRFYGTLGTAAVLVFEALALFYYIFAA